MVIFAFALWALFLNLIYKCLKKFRSNRLPGPSTISILRHATAKYSHLTLSKWAQTYGDIFQIKLGPIRIVVLSDGKLIQEVFDESEYVGRADKKNLQLARPYGMASQGAVPKEQRTFTVRYLSQPSMESFIQEEISEFLTWMSSHEGQMVEMNQRLTLAIVNTLWKILSGKRYPQDDDRILRVLDKENKLNESLSRNPLLLYPPLAELFPRITGWHDVITLAEDIRDDYEQIILECEIDDVKSEHPSFIVEYLREIENSSDPECDFYKDAGKNSLVTTLADLFNEGLTTIPVTLSWAVFYISKFIDVQLKLQEELDKVVPRNRRPCLADRSKLPLPYLEATIMETLRITSSVSTGAMHKTLADMKVRDYEIQTGTWIIANVYHVHHDPNAWQDPDIFLPERFINLESGSVNSTNFSTGEKTCLGETIAKDEIFLFLSNIYQTFNTVLDENESAGVTCHHKPEIVLQPSDFNVLLTRRT
ncbi:unnamed protein product [Allacma fusca]|uniref:Cytochrome P450 n=1 Tax=Allacma fusca TaxID=39272 RepID=A0A8J2PSN5_9HEXA|nr:unnamed protein product [Allacma fusca]